MTSCDVNDTTIVLNFRLEFVQGDQVIVHNNQKANQLPGTKVTKKYFGPITVVEER